MEHRTLGHSGLRVSPLCLGTFNFGFSTPETEALEITHRALDAGINFIDTADYYNGGESERITGKALSSGRRQGIILATKFHFPMPGDPDPNRRGNSRRHIMQAVEGSLQRLGTDWIDLYQVHRPDFEVPQEETLRALDDLVSQGKVRYIGCSTFPAWYVMEALSMSEKHGWVRFVSEQPPYNLLDRRIEIELVPLAIRHGLGLLPWSPLAMGMLAGRYPETGGLPENSRAGQIGSMYAERVNPRAVQAGNRLLPIATELGISAAQLALLWAREQPAVCAPIIGPRTRAHLEDALPVLEMSLGGQTAARLDEIYPPGSAVSDFHNSSGWRQPLVV